MPVSILRASGDNTYDQMTDLENAQERNRMKVEDDMLRMYLQDKAQSDALSDTALREEGANTRLDKTLGANRDLQNDRYINERDIQGTYAEKTAAARESDDRAYTRDIDRTKLTIGPQQTYADIAKSGWDAGAAERETAAKIAGLRGGLIDKMTTGPGGFQLSPDMMTKMSYKLVTGDNAPQTPDELIRSALANRMQNAAPEDFANIAEAYKAGDPSKITVTGPSERSIGQMQQADALIESEVKGIEQFIAANNWRLGKGERDSVINRAKSVLSQLTDARFPPQVIERARQRLKRVIEDSIGGTGMIFETAGAEAMRGAAQDQF
jgi:hypothetical protein